jgi:hypothetical protein
LQRTFKQPPEATLKELQDVNFDGDHVLLSAVQSLRGLCKAPFHHDCHFDSFEPEQLTSEEQVPERTRTRPAFSYPKKKEKEKRKKK